MSLILERRGFLAGIAAAFAAPAIVRAENLMPVKTMAEFRGWSPVPFVWDSHNNIFWMYDGKLWRSKNLGFADR